MEILQRNGAETKQLSLMSMSSGAECLFGSQCRSVCWGYKQHYFLCQFRWRWKSPFAPRPLASSSKSLWKHMSMSYNHARSKGSQVADEN